MLNFYNHKDKVIVHNDSNSSWICISPKETEEIKNYIKNPSIKMDTYLEKLTNLYQIFQESEAKIESIFDDW